MIVLNLEYHRHCCNWCGTIYPHDVPASECDWTEPWYCPDCAIRGRILEEEIRSKKRA